MASEDNPSEVKTASARQAVAGRLRDRLRIAPFIALSVVMAGFSMMIAVGVIDLLAAGRAYVGGESIWSRAHHSAVFHLDRFAETGDPERLGIAEKCPQDASGASQSDRKRIQNIIFERFRKQCKT